MSLRSQRMLTVVPTLSLCDSLVTSLVIPGLDRLDVAIAHHLEVSVMECPNGLNTLVGWDPSWLDSFWSESTRSSVMSSLEKKIILSTWLVDHYFRIRISNILYFLLTFWQSKSLKLYNVVCSSNWVKVINSLSPKYLQTAFWSDRDPMHSQPHHWRRTPQRLHPRDVRWSLASNAHVPSRHSRWKIPEPVVKNGTCRDFGMRNRKNQWGLNGHQEGSRIKWAPKRTKPSNQAITGAFCLPAPWWQKKASLEHEASMSGTTPEQQQPNLRLLSSQRETSRGRNTSNWHLHNSLFPVWLSSWRIASGRWGHLATTFFAAYFQPSHPSEWWARWAQKCMQYIGSFNSIALKIQFHWVFHGSAIVKCDFDELIRVKLPNCNATKSHFPTRESV